MSVRFIDYECSVCGHEEVIAPDEVSEYFFRKEGHATPNDELVCYDCMGTCTNCKNRFPEIELSETFGENLCESCEEGIEITKTENQWSPL